MSGRSGRERDAQEAIMHNLVTAPIRAGRHMAIWLVWQSTGVNLLAPRKAR